MTARVKGKWLERRADELCEMTSKDPKGSWSAFKTQRSNVCPVELAAQFEAFRAQWGLVGTAVWAANASITADELHDCIKR